jgi:hypothetical protein
MENQQDNGAALSGPGLSPTVEPAGSLEPRYTWVALAKDDVRGPPWNHYVLNLDGSEMALCQMPDSAQHADQIVDALNEDFDRFNLRWNADMRAVKRWRAANPGNELVLPDHADLVVWLLEQLDGAAPPPPVQP